MRRNSYRVVQTRYDGFKAQVRYWWMPFLWRTIRYADFSSEGEFFCKQHAKRVSSYEVKYLGKLPEVEE